MVDVRTSCYAASLAAFSCTQKHWKVLIFRGALIDMQDSLSSEDLRQQRDVINKALEEIYKDAPRTDQRAYAAAKRALKAEEELFFTDNELDLMLPHVLRRTKK
jgi:negative regulator of replication initiation